MRNREIAAVVKGASTIIVHNVIPGLPDDIARLCLAFVPLCHHSRLRCVSKAWRTTFSSKDLLEIRNRWNKTEEFLCVFRDDPSIKRGVVFDPRLEAWTFLPPMPYDLSTHSLSNFQCVAIGAELLVIGGSFFDARSYPMEKPVASAAVFKCHFTSCHWERLSNMRVPRGSFACGISGDFIIVAGGGSRHVSLPAEGDRVSAVERYELKNDRWHPLEDMRSIRAGCIGFLYQDEFWVIGGYGRSRTIAGVLPTDEYCRDGEIFDFKTGTWRYLQPMWEEGERRQLGSVAVVDAGDSFGIFMLEGSTILRYNICANIWLEESVLPRKLHMATSCRLVAVDGELFVPSADARKLGLSLETKGGLLFFQVYHPKKRTWRSVSINPRLKHHLNQPWAAVCTIRL